MYMYLKKLPSVAIYIYICIFICLHIYIYIQRIKYKPIDASKVLYNYLSNNTHWQISAIFYNFQCVHGLTQPVSKFC